MCNVLTYVYSNNTVNVVCSGNIVSKAGKHRTGSDCIYHHYQSSQFTYVAFKALIAYVPENFVF